MKIALKIAVVLLALGIVYSLGVYFYARTHSEKIALSIVERHCANSALDPKYLSGPKDGHVGNRAASYSWDYKDTSHHYEFLVSFDYLYDYELAIWDYDRKD
jgi:predicted membrane channel-forming protein YqfA (hemolysin III family)